MPDRQTPDPRHGSAPSQGAGDNGRLDAAGYDTEPPPSPPRPAGGNPGLRDDPPPEREGWREFDANVAWQSDQPYPAEPTDPEPEAEIEPEGNVPADVLTAALAAIEALEGIDTAGISVERQGDTLILRGTATTRADARHAEETLLRIRGVGRVENLLSAG